ncbi:uncharacterized protein EMH_0036180 [Eimeria mitis]|uniref:Uncharacterized protein n=1 Tax=Eimeria mitis TaxID=44415 RepID=U6JR76_9EIME|nr:uncharacterized protein EMH_0036180 [Eimeria mitis]CDJ27939.1 hypothetical protein, conserved [Eimeria mitis]
MDEDPAACTTVVGSSGAAAAEKEEDAQKHQQPAAGAAAASSVSLNAKPEPDAADAAQSSTSASSSPPHSAPDAAAVETTDSAAAAKQRGPSELGNPLLEAEDAASCSAAAARAGSDEKAVHIDPSTNKKRRGLNTAAMRHKNLEQVSSECAGSNLCLSQAACGACDNPSCNKDHDTAAFMKTRPEDLEGECIFFSRYGICPFGCCCRFGRSHLNAEAAAAQPVDAAAAASAAAAAAAGPAAADIAFAAKGVGAVGISSVDDLDDEEQREWEQWVFHQLMTWMMKK